MGVSLKLMRQMANCLGYIPKEMLGSLLLLASALLALIISNTGFLQIYHQLLYSNLYATPSHLHCPNNLFEIINDGFMVFFFLSVSLDIKRGLLKVEDFKYALLPLIAALGGILAPIAFYLFFNLAHPENLQGWAIPTTTDIAFSLGVLSLLGKRIPLALKLFLTTLAVVDDLVAIILIAFFYTQNLQLVWLGIALIPIVGLWFIQLSKIDHLFFYIAGVLGTVLWFDILQSGVHATIAGVLLGFLIPISNDRSDDYKLQLKRLERYLHLWVVYGVLPSFAFANAGLDLSNIDWTLVLSPLFLGIFMGLLLGKPLGIFLASWASVKLGIARLPIGLHWRHVLGCALLGGIGFTMSLFIGVLTFSTGPLFQLVQLAVLSSSVCAASAALLFLYKVN